MAFCQGGGASEKPPIDEATFVCNGNPVCCQGLWKQSGAEANANFIDGGLWTTPAGVAHKRQSQLEAPAQGLTIARPTLPPRQPKYGHWALGAQSFQPLPNNHQAEGRPLTR